MDFSESGGVLIVEPADELDLLGYLPLGDEIGKAMHDGRTKIVIDCTHVSYINAPAAVVIAGLTERAKKAGGALACANLKSGARMLLEASGLLGKISICDSVEKAVAAVGGT
jgi:anti-anti-sigma factor